MMTGLMMLMRRDQNPQLIFVLVTVLLTIPSSKAFTTTSPITCLSWEQRHQELHQQHLHQHRPPYSRWPQRHPASLKLSFDGNQNENVKKIGKKEGVYVRPSAAIERGSGFFVPGLEGPRVRLVGGAVLLILLAVNHVLSTSSSSLGNVFSEGLAALFSVLVLAQGVIESSKENRREALIVEGSSSSSTSSPTSSSYKQQWFVPTGQDEWKSRVEWSAATYLSLTPATHVAMLGPGAIVYWLGAEPAPERSDDVAQACQAALDACLNTESGRVALPASHPAVQYLAPDSHQRCVILQRVEKNSQLVWMISSDQLLASFTQRDLQWMGQLALYMQQPLLL